jgi:hypothetical protein
MFGAANSLLTGLSTVLVVVALIMQASQIKRQEQEQDRLRELLTQTIELQSGQVDGLVTLAMLLKTDGRRKGLEFLVERRQGEIDQLQRIWAGLPSSFAKGSSDDKYRQKIRTKLEAAQKDYRQYSDELKALRDDAHAEG